MKVKNNRKAFTLVELVLVIVIMGFLISLGSNYLGESENEGFAGKLIKDYMNNTLTKIQSYSFNSKTVSQELLKGNGDINTKVSRLNNFSADLAHTNSQVAYYHGLYLTTKYNDSIVSSLSSGINDSFYLVQYRQEGYISLDPRVLEPLSLNVETSPQLIKVNGGLKWSQKYPFPLKNKYYLLKIINSNGDCLNDTTLFDNLIILFSSGNLSYKVYGNYNLQPNFNYKLCFSKDDKVMTQKYASFNISRKTLLEGSEGLISN